MQYLVEQYDTQHSLSYEPLPERQLCNQWLFFQSTGQGPYFGQAAWFNTFHPEKVQSAIDRYTNELHRVLRVLDQVPSERKWLVGDKLTFADISFVMWNYLADQLLGKPGENPVEAYPNVKAWHARLTERPSFKKTVLLRQKYMQEQGIAVATGLPKGRRWRKLLRQQRQRIGPKARRLCDRTYGPSLSDLTHKGEKARK